MEERREISWLQILPVMMAVAILAVSFNGEAVAAAAGAAQPPLDTNVLCVSKCGTCPTMCSTPPPPASSSSSDNNPVLSPPKSSGGGGGGSSSSPSAPSSGEAKGGRPGGSNYYYFFTSGSSHGCTAAGALLLPLLSTLVAVLSQ